MLKVEIENFQNGFTKSDSQLNQEDTLIQVRATLTCPKGDFKKTFRNRFYRKELEMMVVSLKIFDWLVCDKCGEIINLELDFQI